MCIRDRIYYAHTHTTAAAERYTTPLPPPPQLLPSEQQKQRQAGRETERTSDRNQARRKGWHIVQNRFHMLSTKHIQKLVGSHAFDVHVHLLSTTVSAAAAAIAVASTVAAAIHNCCDVCSCTVSLKSTTHCARIFFNDVEPEPDERARSSL